MDKLVNEFTVNRPIDEAWKILTDVERIAPCMPGATLEEIEGDVFRGVVKIKLGAISTAFKGQASFVERDDDAHRAVLKGEGRDTTGKGNASALITARLQSVDDTSTKCNVETYLHITGKVAQFGRGIMGDVSKKLMNQFANNLNSMLDQPATAEEPDAAATTEAAMPDATPGEESGSVQASNGGAVAANDGAPAAIGADPTAPAGNPTATSGVRKINGPAAAPIELSDVAGSAILKRVLPVVCGLVLMLIIIRRLRRR